METRVRVVAVESGVYDVGSDHLADARPRHRRLIDKPFWIDAEPVSLFDFTAFVCGDGYNRDELWPGRRLPASTSVDEHCASLRMTDDHQGRGRRYALGLVWPEAFAIAAFANARLPFEIEWEIAAGRADRFMADVPEWTADVFSPVYWRADFAKRGDARPDAPSGERRTVRGHLAGDLVRDIAVRRGVAPDASGLPCGLRRVWDIPPPNAEIV